MELHRFFRYAIEKMCKEKKSLNHFDTYLYGSAATPFFGPCGRNGDCAGRKGKARGPAGSRAVTGDMPFLRNHAVLFAGTILEAF